jgi:hypothetical protein
MLSLLLKNTKRLQTIKRKYFLILPHNPKNKKQKKILNKSIKTKAYT